MAKNYLLTITPQLGQDLTLIFDSALRNRGNEIFDSVFRVKSSIIAIEADAEQKEEKAPKTNAKK